MAEGASEVIQLDGRRPVCVLGGGRSGTSLVGRAINLLGIDLGPTETMLVANDWNPRGYWEQREINEINDEILAALGGTQIKPPRRNPGWAESPEMAAFRERIERIVARNFSRRRRWGFKDPRTTLTLPIWRSVLGEFDYIICVRNPLEVVGSAESLLPEGHDTFALWLHYTCESLRLTAGRHRTFVFYEDWYVDPLAVSRRLVRFLDGSDDSAADDERCERVVATVDIDLHRNRASDVDLAERDDIALEARALHFLIRDLAAAEALDRRGGGGHVPCRPSRLRWTGTAESSTTLKSTGRPGGLRASPWSVCE